MCRTGPSRQLPGRVVRPSDQGLGLRDGHTEQLDHLGVGRIKRRRGAHAGVEGLDRGQLVSAEFEVEDVDVLGDAVRLG